MKSKPELVKADKALRNRVVAALAVMALAGAVCIRVLNRTLEGLEISAEPAAEAGMQTLQVMFAFLSGMMAVSLIGAGAYLAFLSARTLKETRFPPAGFRVIKDTRVVTGQPARTLGRVGIGLSFFLILMGTVIPVLAWRLLALLAEGTP